MAKLPNRPAQPHEHLRLALHHPTAGDIVVDRVVLRNIDSPSQRLLLFTRADVADPGGSQNYA